MAETPRVQTTVTQQHIENVTSLLSKLKDNANEAHGNGDVFMLGIYSDLVKVVSPICNKAMARLERQDNAEINKKHKALKRVAREAIEKQNQEANKKHKPLKKADGNQTQDESASA